jgi:hypothetical protein
MLESLTTKHKIILASLVFLVVLIPIISFIVSYRFRAQFNSSASTGNKPPTLEDLSIKPLVDNPTPQKTLLDELREDLNKEPTPSAKKDDEESEGLGTTLSLGPTLTFKLNIEGRPKNNMSEPKLFVGIATGQATSNPQYLLSFTVEVEEDGMPKEELPLSGLTTGDTYTAYIKGQTTLTAASTFTVKPTTSNIGTINLSTGDLNEDNAIDQKDKDILMKAYGARESSSKWNPQADFNLDGIINTADLTYITRNMNKNGASGPWYSKLAPSATSSATPSASPSSGGPRDVPSGQPGYWLWVPSTY